MDRSFTDVAVNGAVFSISFNWDCNLDRAVDECDPDVEIRRLNDYANKLSRGYNFRYATCAASISPSASLLLDMPHTPHHPRAARSHHHRTAYSHGSSAPPHCCNSRRAGA